jgi:hypothetical protein
MAEYDIPLSTLYDEGDGKRVEIRTHDSVVNQRFDIVDRTGETPDDLVGLSRGEVEELAHICLAYLNRDRDGTLGYGAKHGAFEEHRVDSSSSELPEYVEYIGRGVNEYECQRCERVWSGMNHEQAANHDCDG